MFLSPFRYIPAHLIAQKLGAERAAALPAFHALTGCDQVASFYGHGKKSAWAVWEGYPELTFHLQCLSTRNPAIEFVEQALPALQKFTNLLYKVCDETIITVNEARFHLIHKKCHDFEKLPPTLDALRLHAMRATYQVRTASSPYGILFYFAVNSPRTWYSSVKFDVPFQGGHIWGNALVKQAVPPSPKDWGWREDGDFWFPVYTRKSIISTQLPDLVICQCSKKCRPPCKCVKVSQPCMSLCKCQGKCYGDPIALLWVSGCSVVVYISSLVQLEEHCLYKNQTDCRNVYACL